MTEPSHDTQPPLLLGEGGDAPLALDLKRLTGAHGCIIANSGGGKSGLLRKILEVTHGRVQHIVLDVEDEFYTLRERYDYVIAGGEGGDVPATLANAAGLARGALEHGFNLVVQLNDLGIAAPRFVNLFLGGLMAAPRDLWHPVLVTIDELQRFASKDAGESIPAIKDLVFRGRKRGFTGLFASLRIAEIDPSIRGMINNWLFGRPGQALDRRTMAEQLGFTAMEGREKLAQIEERHFWAMGPALSIEPKLFRVADVTTTPVIAGQAKVHTPPPPEALRDILAALQPPPAAGPADSGNESRNMSEIMPAPEVAHQFAIRDERIAALEAELVKADERGLAAFEHGKMTGISLGITRCRNAIDALRVPEIAAEQAAVEGAVRGAIHEALGDGILADRGLEDMGGDHEVAAPEKAERAARSESPRAARSADGALPPAEQQILDTLLWCDALYRRSEHDRHVVAAIVGTHVRTKGFLNRLGSLHSAGLIEYGTGTLRLTGLGYALANTPAIQPTVDSARVAVKRILSARQAQILDMLLGLPIPRATIADRLGLHERTKGFLNDLGRLRGLKLIDYHAGGTVQAEPFLRGAAT